MIKLISFDLDDTLSDSRFDELIWRGEIPKAFAKEKGVGFDEAFKKVTGEYKALWGKVQGDWRDASFWLKHFGLQTSWDDLVRNVHHEIVHFPDVVHVLKDLSIKFKLVVVSNAARKFIDAKLNCNELGKFFVKTYSAASDFNKTKKDKEVFSKVLQDFSITPSEMIHVGDDEEYDVNVPKSVGIRAFLLCRSKNKEADLNDLNELKDLIEKINV